MEVEKVREVSYPTTLFDQPDIPISHTSNQITSFLTYLTFLTFFTP